MRKIILVSLAIILILTGITLATDNIDINEDSGQEIINESSTDSEADEYNDAVPDEDINNQEQSIPQDYSNITLKAKVIEAGKPYEEHDEYMGIDLKYQDVKVKITDKKYNGTVLNVKYNLSLYLDANLVSDPLTVNTEVLVFISIEDGKIVDQNIIGINKYNQMIAIGIIFTIGVIAIGGFRGIKALIGLTITMSAIFFVMIPLIFSGKDPMLVTVLTAICVTILTFIIVGGFSKKTVGAILGTSCGILVAGIISVIFGKAMMLSGMGEESLILSTVENGSRFNFKGLMLSGIIIGALGACMDIGMSISSSIEELKRENPDMTMGRLFKSGMNIGRDAIGTMVNTLILAYVGGSLTIILIYLGFNFKLIEVLNQESISEEILRSMAGSIGLIFTIPFTALVSSALMGKRNNVRRDDI